MIFSYPELRQFLHDLKRVAPVCSLAGWNGAERATLLRHDIDLDLEAAYRVCEIEAELGVRSSVLVLTSSDTYNVLSRHNRQRLRELADLGFDVGLHFDPTLYGPEEDLARFVTAEAELIASVTAQPVRTISLHNPSLHGRFPVFDGYINAYQPPWFDPDFYLSDSCMDFRGKRPSDVVGWLQQARVQVLLHPMHFGESARDYRTIIKLYLSEMEARIDAALTEQNKTYRSHREVWQAE